MSPSPPNEVGVLRTAHCGCKYRLVDAYDTRDGGPFKVIRVDPEKRCERHNDMAMYVVNAEIARDA